MDIRLVISDRMDSGSGGESKYIRIPKRARKNFESNTDKITLSFMKKTIVLRIKTAFKEDTQKLIGQVKEGVVSEKESRMTGFVTSAVLHGLMGKDVGPDNYCYLSDDIEDIMVGADPEFALVNPVNQRYCYAENVSGFGSEGTLASDGPLAEIRPPPATDTSVVVDNIRNILKAGHTSIGGLNWIAGATYKSPNHPDERIVHIGGHVHLGDPHLLPNKNKQGIYRQIIRILDEMMALPLVRIDCPHPHLRRNTVHTNGYGRYGQWGDTKPQEGRFEWRVPSGLWLTHPDFAQAVLGTSKAITEQCYQMMAEKNFDNEWICARADRKGFLKSWKVMSTNRAAKIVNDAVAGKVTPTLVKRAELKLRDLHNYSKYKGEVDEFIRLITMSNKDKRNINLDIKDTWLDGGKLIKG
jgi:hypothetical protein